MASFKIAGLEFRIHGIDCGDAAAILQWKLIPLLGTPEQLSSIFRGMTASAEAHPFPRHKLCHGRSTCRHARGGQTLSEMRQRRARWQTRRGLCGGRPPHVGA